jgi:hypothetical protein
MADHWNGEAEPSRRERRAMAVCGDERGCNEVQQRERVAAFVVPPLQTNLCALKLRKQGGGLTGEVKK